VSADRVALVSGGTRGIGRAITECLLADGWSVCATYVSDADSAEAFAATHAALAALRSDAGSSADCRRAVDTAVERFGQLDHVVAAAGITRNGPLATLSDDDWDAVLATNLSGPFRLARAAIPHITTRPHGRIVIISSVAATMGNVDQGAYAASKAGLLGLAKTLARELATTGTTVNLVIPGPTADTGITAETDPAFVAAITRKIPMHRLAQPSDTAFAVRTLLDDRAGYITGTSIVVDGGLSM
jgi:NAD(P)-dependent dehydrogenase (short-subunit alcohol dehydrogenase family)